MWVYVSEWKNPEHVCVSEDSLWILLSPTIFMWVPGIELRSSDLVASAFTPWAISSATTQVFLFVGLLVCLFLNLSSYRSKQ